MDNQTPRKPGLTQQVIELLTDAPSPVTLNQIHHALDLRYEPGELSACMVSLARRGRVIADLVDRPSDKGRRMVKRYRLAGREHEATH